MELESNVSLEFSDKKQLAILGHILTNDKFFIYCKDIVKENWFRSPHVGKAYKVATDYYDRFRRIPTTEEIPDLPDVVVQGQQVRNGIIAQIKDAVYQTSMYSLESVSDELTKWYHSQIFFQGMTKAQKLYNTKRADESYSAIEEVVKEIRNTTFGNDAEETFETPAQDFENLKFERSKALTTGLTLLDRLLLPPGRDENLSGALLPGDTTIVMAPVNTGKTTTCINFMIPNIKAAKYCLFLTHEGRPQDIKKKIWCAYLNVSEIELFEMMTNPAGQERINAASKMLSRFLTYVPMNRAGQRVEDVVSTIRRKQEELIAKRGVGYSMLVDDYPALLTCEQAKHGQLAKRNIDDVVYGNFVQLGLEHKFHVVAAIQVNREGSKINKNASGEPYKPLLTMENVAESFSVMMQATNVITLNRDQDDKSKDRMTMYLDKSRSSETGYAVVCRTNFGHGITHSNELGAAYYRGNTTMSDKIDTLLEQFKNQAGGIPESAWIG